MRAFVRGGPGEREDEELITFRVEDTGCGIRQEDLGKIFEDFRQVDAKRNRSVEGTGLGLAIVKHLEELMGGVIEEAARNAAAGCISRQAEDQK